jgi:glucose dehydrogenase
MASEWRTSGPTGPFTWYSPLVQITPENVSKLTVLWRRPAVSSKLREIEISEKPVGLRLGDELFRHDLAFARERASR